MARTYLLSTIRKWAKELQSKELSNNQLSSIKTSSLNRREFIAGLGAAGMYSMLPKWSKAAVAPRIAIVGAGIAGLACALELRDRGVSATVYEASHRVGGRMFSNGPEVSNSNYWDEGQVSEWCGELIDTSHQTVLKLARRFNLPVDDLLASEAENTEELYYFFGGYYTYSEAKADFAAAYNLIKADLHEAGYPTRYDSHTLAGKTLDQMSIFNWIESRIADGHNSKFGQLLDVAYTIEYGADTSDQSALNLIYLLGYQPNSSARANELNLFGISDERFHIRGGNQKLPEAMKASMENDVEFRLGTQLTKISVISNQRYELKFKPTGGGGFFQEEYDYVVLAIPFAVLREIDYSDAGFDALKNKAIQELGRGRNGKLQLQFDNRFWTQPDSLYNRGANNGATYSDTGYQSSWEVTRGQAGQNGILNLYSGGETTEAMRTNVPFATSANHLVVTDANEGLSQLESVFPNVSTSWNGKVTQSLPHRSPFFKASYSYYRVGQYTAFGGHENVRQGNVLFCGEHTSQDFQGYMEGGASEGVRAAKELLMAL